VNLEQKRRRVMNTKQRGIGDVLFPVANGGIVNTVETHLGTGDLILQGVLDVADCGRNLAEKIGSSELLGRFHNIIAFVEMYRAGNSALIEKLYRAKPHVAA
jgi:hypothetical protein